MVWKGLIFMYMSYIKCKGLCFLVSLMRVSIPHPPSNSTLKTLDWILNPKGSISDCDYKIRMLPQQAYTKETPSWWRWSGLSAGLWTSWGKHGSGFRGLTVRTSEYQEARRNELLLPKQHWRYSSFFPSYRSHWPICTWPLWRHPTTKQQWYCSVAMVTSCTSFFPSIISPFL